jgi:hypothetical protein
MDFEVYYLPVMLCFSFAQLSAIEGWGKHIEYSYLSQFAGNISCIAVLKRKSWGTSRTASCNAWKIESSSRNLRATVGSLAKNRRVSTTRARESCLSSLKLSLIIFPIGPPPLTAKQLHESLAPILQTLLFHQKVNDYIAYFVPSKLSIWPVSSPIHLISSGGVQQQPKWHFPADILFAPVGLHLGLHECQCYEAERKKNPIFRMWNAVTREYVGDQQKP